MVAGAGIGAVEEVGAADYIRTRGSLGIGILQIRHRVIHCMSQNLNALIKAVSRGEGLAPPDDAVAEICIAVVIGLRLSAVIGIVDRCCSQQVGSGDAGAFRNGHTGGKHLLQGGIKSRIAAIAADVLGGVLTVVGLTVCHDAQQLLDLHILTDHICEGYIAGEVLAMRHIHMGGNGDSLLLNGGYQILEHIRQIGRIGNIEVIVIIGKSACIAQAGAGGIFAVDKILGSRNAVSGKGKVFITGSPHRKRSTCIVLFPIRLEAVGGALGVAIEAVAVAVVAVGIGSGIGAGGVGGRVHCDLRQSLAVTGQLIQVYADGIYKAAVFCAGGGTVIMLGDGALKIGGSHSGQEATSFIRIVAMTLLCSQGRIVPIGGAGNKGSSAVGQHDQKRHTGDRFAVYGSGGRSIEQLLGTQGNTGLDIGTAVFSTAAGGNLLSHLGLLPVALVGTVTGLNPFALSTGNGACIPAFDQIAVPHQVGRGGSAVIVAQGGQHIGCGIFTGTVAVALAGEGYHGHTVVGIGSQQRSNGSIGSSDHLLCPVIICHTAGGIQHKYSIHRHIALAGKTHYLGSLGHRNNEVILSRGKAFPGRQCHRTVADRFAHSNLTGILGIVAVDITRAGQGLRIGIGRDHSRLGSLGPQGDHRRNRHQQRNGQRQADELMQYVLFHFRTSCKGNQGFHKAIAKADLMGKHTGKSRVAEEPTPPRIIVYYIIEAFRRKINPPQSGNIGSILQIRGSKQSLPGSSARSFA